jgi:uncharacterized protein YllA (UPF0747 family)
MKKRAYPLEQLYKKFLKSKKAPAGATLTLARKLLKNGFIVIIINNDNLEDIWYHETDKMNDLSKNGDLFRLVSEAIQEYNTGKKTI